MTMSRSLKHYRRDAILSVIIGWVFLFIGVLFRVFPVATIVFFALALLLLLLGGGETRLNARHLQTVNTEESS